MNRDPKDLDSLMRLQGWAVDERRRDLGALLARQDALLEQDRALDQSLISERDVARGEPRLAGHVFTVYVKDHFRRKEQMAALLHGIAVEIEAARERLADAYREQKVLDEVREKWATARRIEEGRREQAFYDEVAQTRHVRRG